MYAKSPSIPLFIVSKEIPIPLILTEGAGVAIELLRLTIDPSHS